MRLIFLILTCTLFSFDYDCIVIGTSPFSLFEALYQHHSGKRVLILEGASDCGGAWKSIEICGIPNADLGCHQIGQNMALKSFLETYAGCTIVSLDNPKVPFEEHKGPNGWYFASGCHELVDHLVKLIDATDIALHLNEKAETMRIDSQEKLVIIESEHEIYSTKKLILTPMCTLSVDCQGSKKYKSCAKHYHLYMLIQDPSPSKFTYRGGVSTGISRMMNLSHFVGLEDTDQQLIAIQTYNDQYFGNAQIYLDALKAQNLVDSSAYILDTDTYIYHSGVFHYGSIRNEHAKELVELLQTGHIQNLSNYISKWEKVLKPYQEALGY